MGNKFQFWHQRLDAYQVALEFVRFVEAIDSQWFRGRYDRRRQLSEAADAIPLNIAEGASQTSLKVRKNHYRIALGSTGECDAILQILQIKGCPVEKGRNLTARLGAMLYRM